MHWTHGCCGRSGRAPTDSVDSISNPDAVGIQIITRHDDSTTPGERGQRRAQHQPSQGNMATRDLTKKFVELRTQHRVRLKGL